MSAPGLTLFPARVAIGTVQGASVYMSREFERALSDLVGRVGGATGASTDDLAVELTGSAPAALALGLLQTVADLQLQVETLSAQLAQAVELAKGLAHLELATVNVPAGTDWEHPGKVGAGAPNSGKFTALEATDKVKLSPAGKDVEIKPTGAALVTIKPENPGQLDNMELGKTTPRPATVTTINKMTIVAPANGCTLAIAEGKTLAVGNSMTLFADDGAVLNFSAGPGATFVRRTGTALAPVATDPASTQALANSLRSVLLSVGIGS